MWWFVVKLDDPKIQQSVLGALFGLLILFGPLILIYHYLSPNFSIIDSLSAGSTYAVAILTFAYAFTTSKQLGIMASQLNEMRTDRELQHQPMPWIKNTQFIIEKPRLYFSPPENEVSFIPRYCLYIGLKNIGDSPAIAINLTSQIALADDIKGSNWTYYSSVSRHINILEPTQIFPPHPSHGVPVSFNPPEGKDSMLINSMRENDLNMYPHLQMRIIYKNILGGCFLLSNEFRLYPINSEQAITLKNWATQIAAFPLQYKEELGSMRRLIKPDYKKFSEIFDKVQSDLSKAITEGDLELSLEPIPGTFKSEVISEDKYQKYCESLHYGVRLSPIGGCACCEDNM